MHRVGYGSLRGGETFSASDVLPVLHALRADDSTQTDLGSISQLAEDSRCAFDALAGLLPEDARTTSSTDRLVASGAASESITRRRETQHSKWYIVPRIDLDPNEY